MNRLAHSYVVGATAGMSLIAAAVVGFVLLVSMQAMQEWPVSGLNVGIGNDDKGIGVSPARELPSTAPAQSPTLSGPVGVGAARPAPSQAAPTVAHPPRTDRHPGGGGAAQDGRDGAGRISAGSVAGPRSAPTSHSPATPPSVPAPTPSTGSGHGNSGNGSGSQGHSTSGGNSGTSESGGGSEPSPSPGSGKGPQGRAVDQTPAATAPAAPPASPPVTPPGQEEQADGPAKVPGKSPASE
jgi:uncharacterized membrane protein YgcG